MTELERLTALLDHHWLQQDGAGIALCTCGDWRFDANSGQHPLPVLGERFAPFSEHVAVAALSSKTYYDAPEPDDLQRRCWIIDDGQCRLYNGHEGVCDFGGLREHERTLVDRMARELVANHHKQEFTELPPAYILSELHGHAMKLAESGSWEHAADVANLAAMYAIRVKETP